MNTLTRPHRGPATTSTGGVARRCLRATAAIAAAVSSLLAAPVTGVASSPSGSGAAGPSLGVVPLGPAADLSPTGAYFTPTIVPGSRWAGGVVAVNSSNRPLGARVYATDALTAPIGGVVYPTGHRTRHGAGAWVTAAQRRITVAPHQSLTVPFVVAVPAGTTPGDHVAGLAVEVTEPSRGSGTFAVSTVTRVVLAVVVHVPGGLAPHLQVSGVDLQMLPGNRGQVVAIGLRNDGQTLTRPLLTVTVSGSSGYRRAVAASLGTMLPGDPVTRVVPWPDPLPAGAYTVDVRAAPPGAPETAVETAATLDAGATGSTAGDTLPMAVARLVGAERWSPVRPEPLLLLVVVGGLVIIRLRLQRHLVPAGAPRRERGGRSLG